MKHIAITIKTYLGINNLYHASRLFFTGFLIFFICNETQGQNKDSIQQLPEVILPTYAHKEQALGITPVSTLSTISILNAGPLNFSNAVNQISGVYMFSGALNTQRITIRGIGSRTPFGTNKLRMYFDNIPITNGTGESTLEAFDLENMTSIEIVKGPKATAFGTQLGGALLLNTINAFQHKNYFSNTFSAGSYGLLKNNFSFSHGDEKWQLAFRYGLMHTDGYRDNSQFDRQGVLLNLKYNINAKNSISLLLNQIDYKASIPSSLNLSDFREDPRQAAFTWKSAKGYEDNKYTLVGLTYAHKLHQKFENATSIFYTYLDHYEARPFNILDEYTHGYGLRSVFTLHTNFFKRNSLLKVGLESYRDQYQWQTFRNLYRDNNGEGSLQGSQISENKEFRNHFNVFSSLEIPFTTEFKAQFGLSLQKTNYDYRDLFNQGIDNKDAERKFDFILNPSVDLSYTPNSNYHFFANISRGFSNPGLEETLNPDGQINPDIQQETGWSYEAGAQFSFFESAFDLTINLFQINIKNLLVAERIGEDQYIGKNAGQTKHQGIETDLKYKIKLNENLSLTPAFSYTYNHHRFVDFVDEEQDYSGNDLTGVPAHRLNTQISIKHIKGIFWSLNHQYVGEMPLTDANSLNSESFSVLNTKIGYAQWLGKSFRLGLDLGLNNVLNKNYMQSVLINATGFGGSAPRYYYPSNNRNYYAMLSLGLKL